VAVKMELTPPTAQESRLGIHPKLFAAIIRSGCPFTFGRVDVSFGLLLVSFGMDVIVRGRIAPDFPFAHLLTYLLIGSPWMPRRFRESCEFASAE
jgi:hypothetical protein